jgi:hypothetical protein
MARPIPDPDRPFPWEHDNDLEQPGVTIRPLSLDPPFRFRVSESWGRW